MRDMSRPGGMDPERTTDLDDPDTQEIRVEIEQTRTEMSGTIDAIQQKLAPEVLTEQAKDVARDAAEQAKEAAQEVLKEAVREVKDAALTVTEHAVQEVKEAAREVTHDAKDAAWDATVGRAEDAVSSAGETARGVGSMVLDTIKANPIPAALAGASLYWLYSKRSHAPSTSYGRSPYPTQQAYPVRATSGTTGYGTTYDYDATRTGADRDLRRTTPGSQSQGGQSTVGAITDTVTGAASQVGDVASDVASSAGQMVSSAASTAGQYASSAGETAMDTGSDVVALIRANPIPAALVGLGLGWLYMNRSSGGPDYRAHSRDHYRYPPEYRYGSAGSSTYGSGSYGSSTYGSSGSQGGVGDMARQAGSQVSDAASGVTERVSDMASGVTEQVGDLAGAVVDRTTRAPGQIQRMINENPIMTAALAATLGAATGLMLPPTQTEDQFVGASRDRVMGKAQQAASDAVDKVQSVAQEVQHTANREAQAQGLTV